MRVAVIGNYLYPYCIEHSFTHAFRELGHTVICSNTAEEDVDISFVLNGKGLDPTNLHGVKVLFFVDSVQRFPDFFSSIKDGYDYIFLALYDKILEKYDNMFFVMGGYDHVVHKYLPNVRKIYEVTFVGTYRPEREFIRKIPNIKIYGNGWGKSIFPIYGHNLTKVNNRSKIILNTTFPGDDYNGRIFEILAQRCFLLTDKHIVFEDGKDLVTYSSEDDLHEKIKYYLSHPEEREKIAEQGYRSVQKHSYTNRVKEILNIVLGS